MKILKKYLIIFKKDGNISEVFNSIEYDQFFREDLMSKIALKTISLLTTVKEVEEFIKKLEKKGLVSFRPVGDNECNCGIININKNPISGNVERIINMVDSYLQKLAIEHEDSLTDEDKKSPRALIEKTLKIKDGRLENLDDLAKRREISKNMNVIMRDSGKEDKPTVDFRDYGIGILPSDMPYTILSLNKSSKISLHFTIGTFGQGGSTAFPSAIYTIIITKQFTKDKSNNKVGFTIVRYNSRLGKDYKMGVYEYLVDRETNMPFEIIDDKNEFEPGTLVRQVESDFGKYIQRVTQPSGNSLWALTNEYLFDSVLPIWIDDYREKHSKNKNKNGRTVSGNYTRLESKKDDYIEEDGVILSDMLYKMEHKIKLRNEELTLKYWVNNFEKNKNYMKQFIDKSHPVIITLNGQKHGEMTARILKDNCKLPYLYDEMAVHISCDSLSYDLRREVFSSTRESLKENVFLDELEEAIVECISNDDNLKYYNKNKRLLLTKSKDSENLVDIAKKIGSKLSKNLGVVIKEDENGTEGEERNTGSEKPASTNTPNTPNTPKTLDPIKVNNPPTFLKIDIKNKSKMAGKFVSFKISTDADAKYFSKDAGKFNIRISDKENFKIVDENISVVNGRGQFHLNISEDAKIGAQCLIYISLDVNGELLTDKAVLNVIDIKESKPKKKTINTPKTINITKVYNDSEFWVTNMWTGENVAEVIFSDSGVDIYVSMENNNYKTLRKQFERASEGIKSAIESKYIETLIYDILYYELKKKDIELNLEEDINRKNQQLVYDMASKSICSFIGDNRDMFTTNNIE